MVFALISDMQRLELSDFKSPIVLYSTVLAPPLLFGATMQVISRIDGPEGRLTKIVRYGTLTADPLISDAAFPFLCFVCFLIGIAAAFVIANAMKKWPSNPRNAAILLLLAGVTGTAFALEGIYSAFFGTVLHGYPLPKDVPFEPFILSFAVALLIPSLLFVATGGILRFSIQKKAKPRGD